jgi:hypothetical protein
MNWQKMLKSYMKHVIQAESISFLDYPIGRLAVEVELAPEEQTALREIEKMVQEEIKQERGTPEEQRDRMVAWRLANGYTADGKRLDESQS